MSVYEYQYVKFTSENKSPYKTGAVLTVKNGINEVDDQLCTLEGDVTSNDYFIKYTGVGNVVFPNVFGLGTGDNVTIGFWIRPSEGWISRNGSIRFENDGVIEQSYIYTFFQNQPSSNRLRIFKQFDTPTNQKETYFSDADFVANQWYYVVINNLNSRDPIFNGQTKTGDAANTFANTRTDTSDIRIRNNISEIVDIWGLSIWDDADVWATVSEQYPLITPPNDIIFPDSTTGQEFILSTQKPNLGYGDSGRKIFNKGLKTNPIRYQIQKSGLQQIQNTSISFSNVDNFYHQMRELNGADFWIGLSVDIYWANGRVPTLVYDGSNWKEDGENVVSFTPDVTYPYATIQDSIKKEFSGYVQSGSQGAGTTSLALISQEKQDSYLLGTINSARGADSSKAKITPILIGDLTDENAFVPLVLNNDLYNVPSGLCSDIDLTEAPTPYIYDDEGERFYEVKNISEFVDNRKLVFYDNSTSRSPTVDQSQVIMNGFKDKEDMLVTRDGEIVYAFSNNIKLTPFDNVLGGYTDYKAYIQDGLLQYREGSRNYNNLTDFNNSELSVPSNPVDEEIIKAKALINLELRPIAMQNDFEAGYAINSSLSSRTYTKINGNGSLGPGASPVNTNGLGTGPEPNTASKMECAGRAKGIIDYDFNSQSTYDEVTLLDNTTYLQFSPSHGEWNGNNYLGSDASGWTAYNYFNYGTQYLKFDFNSFKFDGDLKTVSFTCVGSVKGDFTLEPPTYGFEPTISCQAGFIYTDKDSVTQGQTVVSRSSGPFGDNFVNDFNNSYSLISDLSTVQDLKNSNPKFYFFGCSLLEPAHRLLNFGFGSSWSGTIDYATGSFGRHRFFLEGVKFNAEVSAVVESKYWCFKGKSGDFNLVEGLQALASRYTNSTITARGQNRNNWNISGVVLKEPIYYRDLLAQIANEFRVFITDENGASEIVPMETGDFDYTIDESNVFKPFNENVTYGETPSTEIYNKIVVRYAYNHMTGNFGKTLEIDSSGFSLNAEPDSLAKAPLSAGIPQANLEKADAFLEKIGITEKIKRVDLNWIRDDFTAIRVAGWWCEHMSRQRARVTVNVSKRQFLNAKIGEFCKLSLPDLPIFYKGILQITKINNKGKSFELDLEEYL